MKRIALIGAAGLLAYGAWLLYQQSQTDRAAESCDTCNTVADTLDNIMNATKNALGLWHPPAQYAATIAAAEDRNGIPRDVLARLLYQESRYRADIITGATRSPVGALGIAQFMPATATEMGIDPLNPTQAIDGAARYLARLYRSLGTWTQALAAYNWGIGNVQRKGIAAAPRETRLYYSQILSDVNSTNGTAYA